MKGEFSSFVVLFYVLVLLHGGSWPYCFLILTQAQDQAQTPASDVPLAGASSSATPVDASGSVHQDTGAGCSSQPEEVQTHDDTEVA